MKNRVRIVIVCFAFFILQWKAWLDFRARTFLPSLQFPYLCTKPTANAGVWFILSSGIQCPALSDVKNSVRNPRADRDFYFGDTVSYTCITGYTRAGFARLTCLGSGTWSASEPSCDGELFLLKLFSIFHHSVWYIAFAVVLMLQVCWKWPWRYQFGFRACARIRHIAFFTGYRLLLRYVPEVSTVNRCLTFRSGECCSKSCSPVVVNPSKPVDPYF